MAASELLARYEALGDRSATEEKIQFEAYQEALAQCMRAAGFEFVPQPWREHGTEGDPTWNPGYLEQWGYGVSTAPPSAAILPVDNNEVYLESLGPAAREEYFLKLEGGATHGCRDEAAEAVPTQEIPFSALMDEVGGQIEVVYQAARELDPRLVGARQAARDCMKRAGIDDYDPQTAGGRDAVLDAWEKLQEKRPSAVEIEQFRDWERLVATAEYACVQPIIDAEQAVLTAAQVEVVERYRPQIEDYLNQAEAALSQTVAPDAGAVPSRP